MGCVISTDGKSINVRPLSRRKPLRLQAKCGRIAAQTEITLTLGFVIGAREVVNGKF